MRTRTLRAILGRGLLMPKVSGPTKKLPRIVTVRLPYNYKLYTPELA